MQAGLYLSTKSPQLTWVVEIQSGPTICRSQDDSASRKLADIFGEAVQERNSSFFSILKWAYDDSHINI